MPTAFIVDKAIMFPRKTAAGEPMSENDAALLCFIQRNRIVSKLRYALQRGDIAPHEAQARANLLLEQPMEPYGTTDDEDAENDPILQEALAIARELIVTRMANEGLPPPRGLDVHAKALVDGMPELQERARKRIEARYQAAEAALASIS